MDEPSAGHGVVHVVRHDPGDAERAGQRDELSDECLFLGEAVVPAFDGQAAVEQVEERGHRLRGALGVASGQAPRHPAGGAPAEREQAAGVAGQRIERDGRVPARRVHAGAGDEGAQVPVPFARLGQHDEVGPVAAGHHRQFGAQDTGEAQFPRRLGEPDRAAEVVVVGEGQGRHA